MKKLISKGMILTLIMSVAPAMAMAKDTSSSQQPTATFQTLSNLSTGDSTHPATMTGQQLAAVEGMAGICADCVIATHGSLAQEIIAATQALVNQRMQNLPQGEELAQEIIASTQALVNQMPQLQNGASMSQGQDLAREITASTQALVNQTSPNLPQGEGLAREIIASTQAIINRSLSRFQVPNGSYRSHNNGLPRVSKGEKGMSHKVPRALGKGSHPRTKGKGMMHNTVKTPRVKMSKGVHRGFKGLFSKKMHGMKSR